MVEAFREGQPPEIPSNTEGELPEPRLSDELLGNLDSSVGNSEVKCLTISGMQKGVIYPSWDVYRMLIDMQGEYKGWRMSHKIPFQYCRDSFAHIGLVAMEAIDQNLNTYGYSLTDYGYDIGIPYAGHMLSFSERHPDVSLIQIYGNTASSSKSSEVQPSEEVGAIEIKKRSPAFRHRLFRELVTTNAPITEGELVNRLQEKRQLIYTHLRDLNQANIITYESRGIDEDYVFYHLSPQRPKQKPDQYRSEPAFTEQVYGLVSNHPEETWTRTKLVDALINEYPDKQLVKRNTLLRTGSGILSYLANAGYLETEKFTERVQSNISLSETQRGLLSDLIETTNRFQTLDPSVIREGRRMAYEIISDPQRVTSLMLKAKEKSPYANRTASREIMDILASIVQERPNSTSSQIQEVLEREYDKRLTPQPINRYLNALKKQEKVQSTETKGVLHWTLTR